jgi:hypothetical protein
MSFFDNIFVNLLKLLSEANVFCTNHKYIHEISFVGAWILFGVLFYRVLYGLLKIKRTFISCIKFLLFYVIFMALNITLVIAI